MFDTVMLEDTGMAFLELTTAPDVTEFIGWESITINNCESTLASDFPGGSE